MFGDHPTRTDYHSLSGVGSSSKARTSEGVRKESRRRRRPSQLKVLTLTLLTISKCNDKYTQNIKHDRPLTVHLVVEHKRAVFQDQAIGYGVSATESAGVRYYLSKLAESEGSRERGTCRNRDSFLQHLDQKRQATINLWRLLMSTSYHLL